MEIEKMSKEELDQALLADITAEDNSAEGTNSETEEELETPQDQSKSNDDGQKEEERSDDQKELPKSNSVKKILSERNQARSERDELQKRIKEIEGSVGTSRELDIEYVNAIATKAASELMYESEFFSSNPEAKEHKTKIKEMAQEHNLDYDRAYKLLMLESDPDELRVQENKKNAKKLSTPSYSSDSLRAAPSAKDMSTKELESKIKELIGK
jgi:hypothetical protein